MAVRASMADLITAVRLLVNDPNPGVPTVPVFTDQQYQDALDHTRQDVRYLELAGAANIASGGVVTWLDYYAMSGSAGIGDWEADAAVLSNTFATLAPTTSDSIVGHWTFSTDTRPPVYLVGKTYDRYGAAVEILEDWAAQLAANYDFSAGGQHFRLSQQPAGKLALAAHYKMKMRVRMAQMERSDVPQELWQRRNFAVSRTSF